MRQHYYPSSMLGAVLLVAGLLSLPAAAASAVSDESSAYPEKQADLETVIEQLQVDNPGLSKDEAMELAGLASVEAKSQGPLTPGREAGENPAGIIVQGPGSLGPDEMTPEEQALAEKVGTRANELAGQGFSREKVDSVLRKEFEQEFKQFEGIAPGERDDAHLKELSERGVPGMERAGGLEQRGGGAEVERYREMMERGAAQEQTSRELPSVERGEQAPVSEREAPQPREIEQYREAPEAARETVQREAPETTTRETVQREGSGSGPEERPEQYQEFTPPQG